MIVNWIISPRVRVENSKNIWSSPPRLNIHTNLGSVLFSTSFLSSKNKMHHPSGTGMRWPHRVASTGETLLRNCCEKRINQRRWNDDRWQWNWLTIRIFICSLCFLKLETVGLKCWWNQWKLKMVYFYLSCFCSISPWFGWNILPKPKSSKFFWPVFKLYET